MVQMLLQFNTNLCFFLVIVSSTEEGREVSSSGLFSDQDRMICKLSSDKLVAVS